MTDQPELQAPNKPSPSDYPPPPWKARGELWMSLFRTRKALMLPTDLTPVGGRHTLITMLARYTEGTLRYDEFAVGSLVRRGRHAGVLCHRIWVDSTASLYGGRQLWGIPKELASFSWSGGSVQIRRDAGPIATLRVAPHSRRRIPVSHLPGIAFGQIATGRTLLVGRVAGRLGTSRITPTEWHDPLPALSTEEPRLALSVSQARFFFPEGTRLGPTATQTPEAGS
ncbi:acetoacetate decarboxylase family protein [Streptomyces lateritius]|uniref:acetoacetate decarboxylase family protein n=1 Tax=Streptomyces lateritius TaxID=67313 RepID=UPI001671F932|nr:acetoacetate decarboxylase family protein [Streptomyces lateritius]GGU15116.1 acetoacetate decarboxylase [Streptomyces lateritius]